MSRLCSIRRMAGLVLLLTGLGTAAAGAPIAPAVAEDVAAAVAETAMVPQHLLAATDQAQQDDLLPATAGSDASDAATDVGLSAFLRSIIMGPEAADVLAMVSAPFRGSGGQPARIVLCAVEDVCGLTVLPDLTDPGLRGRGLHRPELVLARADAVLPADPLDLRIAHHGARHWGGTAPARDGDGRAEPPEPLTLRRLALEALAVLGLDEIARTLWSMPLFLVALVLSPVLFGMLTLGRRVPRRRHP